MLSIYLCICKYLYGLYSARVPDKPQLLYCGIWGRLVACYHTVQYMLKLLPSTKHVAIKLSGFLSFFSFFLFFAVFRKKHTLALILLSMFPNSAFCTKSSLFEERTLVSICVVILTVLKTRAFNVNKIPNNNILRCYLLTPLLSLLLIFFYILSERATLVNYLENELFVTF